MSERDRTLIEAYWKLRDHASALRGTTVHRRAKERLEANREDQRLYQRYAWLESNCRGIETAADDLAEMLGVPEHEIERADGAAPGALGGPATSTRCRETLMTEPNMPVLCMLHLGHYGDHWSRGTGDWGAGLGAPEHEIERSGEPAVPHVQERTDPEVPND